MTLAPTQTQQWGRHLRRCLPVVVAAALGLTAGLWGHDVLLRKTADLPQPSPNVAPKAAAADEVRPLPDTALLGRVVDEATAALQRYADAWDRRDFRAIRDLYTSRPGETTELAARCRAYLAQHPQGRFAGSVRGLLRWTEQVAVPHEYHVKLRDGMFDRKVAHFFSRGPKLSVELEVGGVRYGPSPIIVNRYDPVWNYDFPRPVHWKLGDPVRIRVTEHSWRAGVVVEMASAEGDPLALAVLTGDIQSGKNRLTFECTDFRPPILPNSDEDVRVSDARSHR